MLHFLLKHMNIERQPITDIFKQLQGRVSMGVMNRVAQLGGEIPEWGLGKYSVPKALLKAKDIEKPQKSKQERRSWNLNHQA